MIGILVGENRLMTARHNGHTFLALWRDMDAAARAMPPTGDWFLIQAQVALADLYLVLTSWMREDALQGYVVDPGLPGEQVVVMKREESSNASFRSSSL